MYPPVVTTSVAIGVGTVLITTLGVLILKKIRREKVPTEWEQVGTVAQLLVYPLKSGKGVHAEHLFVTEKGVRETDKNDSSIELRDRSFLIYTSKDKEVRTARQIPKSVLVEIQAAQKGIILKAPGKVDLYIGIPSVKNDVRATVIWGATFGNETFRCTDCGDSAAKWLSTFLLDKDEGLRLGYGDGNHTRNVLKDHKKWAEYFTGIDNSMAGIFSDLAALHLINVASVDDLNRKLANDHKVGFKNFRPNILVDGPQAFAEDHWTYLKIGEVVTKVCLECLRCIESTVTENGELSKHREPLRTLESYRTSVGPFKYGMMGIYLKVLKTGKISKGDSIYLPKND